jgi:prephenate dehydrogenase
MKKGEMLLAYHERLTTQNAKELDMLVVSVYPKAFKKVLQEFLPHLKNGAIIKLHFTPI